MFKYFWTIDVVYGTKMTSSNGIKNSILSFLLKVFSLKHYEEQDYKEYFKTVRVICINENNYIIYLY